MRHKELTDAHNSFSLHLLNNVCSMTLEHVSFFCKATIASVVSLYKSLQGHSSLRIEVCNPGVKC